MIGAVGGAIRCELLKLKRTLALRMIVVAPALVACLSVLAQSQVVINGRSDLAATLWESHSQTTLTIWAMFLLPLLIALETALVSSIEHAEKQWKHLFALPVPRAAIYTAKFAVAQLLILVSTLLLCALIVLSGWLLIAWHPVLSSAGPPPVRLIFSRAILCWLAAGFILSINLWVALRWPSFTVPLGLGITGTFFALFATSAKAARYCPWLLPLNAVSEHPAAAVAIGTAGGVLVAILGFIDFNRREESAPPQLSRPAVAALTAIVAAFGAFAAYLDWPSLSNRETPHTTQFITVEKGVRLEVLDWGGSGRPVVLIAGLGDTAHVFNQFASRLNRQYHVYGITRRGFGASSHPASGYSADRLGDDVVGVIDALHLVRPVLVGHSLGGEELSSVGLRYPQKVSGLVYLDAGYSYAYYDPSRGDFNIDLFALDEKLQKLKPGSGLRDPRPVMADIADSLPGFERVLRRKIRELGAFTSRDTGSSPRKREGFTAAVAIMAGQQKYPPIHVPILAIYALPHDMGSTNPRRGFAEAQDVTNITGPQAKAFEKAMPWARVVRLPHATHYVFQSNESDVLREMNAFIARLRG